MMIGYNDVKHAVSRLDESMLRSPFVGNSQFLRELPLRHGFMGPGLITPSGQTVMRARSFAVIEYDAECVASAPGDWRAFQEFIEEPLIFAAAAMGVAWDQALHGDPPPPDTVREAQLSHGRRVSSYWRGDVPSLQSTDGMVFWHLDKVPHLADCQEGGFFRRGGSCDNYELRMRVFGNVVPLGSTFPADPAK